MNTNEEQQNLMQVWLDIAEELLDSGAEISRVENTLRYLAMSQNAQKIDAFTITAGILVSCTFADGNTLTQTRRVTNVPSMNVRRIEKLNALSRAAYEKKMSAKDLSDALREMKDEPSPRTLLLGGVIASAAFSIFFGGTVLDAVCSGLFGLLICLFSEKAGRYFTNRIFYNFLTSVLAGVLIYLTARIIPGLHTDKVIIGDIMLLVPGLSFTMAMRDMLAGDTISGVLRFVESILWTGGLAAGFLAAMVLAGGLTI